MKRRDLLKLGIHGTIALALSRRALGGETKPHKHCIVLWMNGGPSHVDTFDPKPNTPASGPFRAAKTSASGVEISEHLPHLAEQAHRLAIVRGMTSKEGNHERAQYLGHTGYPPNPTVGYPALGAWVSEEIAPKDFDLMSFVSVMGPSAPPGFLGVEHGPFVIPNPNLPPENTSFAPGVAFPRFVRRRAALDIAEKRFASDTKDPKVESRLALRDKAIRMMFSSRLRAFDLKEETEAVRRRYGDSDFGRGCLLARRLVEAGVPFVEVSLDGWDTHQDNFNRTKKLMGVLDPAMSALLEDLAERELLDRTLILWMGEFGRTPKINPQDGRDHHPAAWSAVLAGCGAKGGVVIGKTDATGERVVEDPITVPNLFATVAALLGMDPAKSFDTPAGRPVAITDGGKPIARLIG